MMAVAAPHPYVEALLKGSPDLTDAPAGGLSALRARGLERANALSVPTTRDEEWRFTDISPLLKIPFPPASSPQRLTLADIARWIVPEAQTRLTFVDGVFAPELSARSQLSGGAIVTQIAAATGSRADLIEAHLGRYADFGTELFSALNTASLRDGALVWIGRGQEFAQPIHLLFVATQKEATFYPRCLIITESGAACTVIEDYVGIGDAVSFTNAVTEVVVGAGARVQHVKLQREAPAAFHIASTSVVLGKDANYVSGTVSLGARISRHNLSVVQQGEGANCRIDGLALVSGRQLADTHTTIDHATPNGKSTQLHKTIVGGAAHAVFNGKIVVRAGAQLTDSAQQSRNLLLSPRAHVDTKPQLEIFADDVKCAHGATVGQLDAEQLFYLKSRGLPETQARNLLTYAFGAEVIDRLPVGSLVERLERVVMEQTQAAA
jgi:Fe-S cluster assembly protein SufD